MSSKASRLKRTQDEGRKAEGAKKSKNNPEVWYELPYQFGGENRVERLEWANVYSLSECVGEFYIVANPSHCYVRDDGPVYLLLGAS